MELGKLDAGTMLSQRFIRKSGIGERHALVAMVPLRAA